jgi:hypothetical protein
LGYPNRPATAMRSCERLRGCFWIIDSFYLDERGVWVCVTFSALVG